MDWRELLKSHILQRGYEYYYEGAVEELEFNNNTLHATVFGAEDYSVEIKLDGDEISYMKCSCPYAERGNNCKHMAAVLLEWENGNNEIENNSKKTTNTKDEIRDVIKQANEQQIQEFLYDLFRNDQKLFFRFKTIVTPHLSSNDIEQYINQINYTILPYLGRGRYIDYDHVYAFFHDINQYFYNDIQNLIDSKEYETAFDLSILLLRTVCNIDIDDSNGHSELFICHCLDVWDQIYDEANDSIKNKMFKTIQQLLNEEFAIEIDYYLMDYFMDNFHEEIFLNKKLDYIDNNLEICKDYMKRRWINLRIEVMKKLNYSIIEIKKFCKKYWQNTEARNIYVSYCLSEKNYSEAIRVLKESINIEKDYRGIVIDYHRQLKDIYRKIENMENYKKELYDLVIDSGGNLTDYEELKSAYSSDEWIPIRDQLLSVLKNEHCINELYIEEKLYDKLLSNVLGSNNLDSIIRYTETLKSIYPKELLQKCKECVCREVVHTSNRSNYQRLVRVLRKMQTISGGEIIVQDIVNEWRIKYRNRSAMMDELNILDSR